MFILFCFNYLHLEFDAIQSHDYAAKCEISGTWLVKRKKANWWVEINDLDSSEVVSKSDVIQAYYLLL